MLNSPSRRNCSLTIDIARSGPTCDVHRRDSTAPTSASGGDFPVDADRSPSGRRHREEHLLDRRGIRGDIDRLSNWIAMPIDQAWWNFT